MEDAMKIVKSLDESGLPVKEISERIKNETKKYKKEYLFQCYQEHQLLAYQEVD